MITGFHVGRDIEDVCPCPQEACGCVGTGLAVDGCPMHDLLHADGERQAHALAECPGVHTETSIDKEIANHG
ncbi:hypothetical protein ACQP2T_63875 (plasmid) [Nonomuraea sp. CA-143628]|uniref:hypothetical protein n=1 Tax=Nonomuraea sp. CA-143628 TaxID=3239997 RepID=UPI003D8B87F7